MRLTINLSEEVDLRLRSEAQRRGMTLSALAGEAIERHLAGAPSWLRSGGIGRSGYEDTSERVDEVLAAEVIPYLS